MPRYTEREFRLGNYWLSQRVNSPAWCRTWYCEQSRQTKKVSLGTTDYEEAKDRLTEWFIKNQTHKDEKQVDALLADIIRRYWEGHAQHIPSAVPTRIALNQWLEFWGTSSIADIKDVQQQERFHAFLRTLGHKNTTINRTIAIGKAAINRAWKRGELEAVPYIAKVKDGAMPPKGRPLSVDEIKALFNESAPHCQKFILWMLGTAARPDAILELHITQIDVDARLVMLNPEGREQTKKYRPIVRLPESLVAHVGDRYMVQFGKSKVGSIKTAWRAARRRAGLDNKVQPYSLRHTAARWMRKQGVSNDEVAQQLGHRKLGTTGTYTEYDPNYLTNACEALDELLRASCV